MKGWSKMVVFQTARGVGLWEGGFYFKTDPLSLMEIEGFFFFGRTKEFCYFFKKKLKTTSLRTLGFLLCLISRR